MARSVQLPAGARTRVNFQGLVLGLPYWPLFALFGAVVAWNLFTLLAYVGAGGAACAWLRALGLPRGAALAGGLAFALAPYRVAQSTGHLLGPISLFLPLALFFVERRRTLLAAAAITAIPLSGQVSLAVGAVPFFIAYAFVRGRGLRDALPGTVGAVVAGELVQHFVISGSTHEEGRSLSEVGRYSADWIGFLSRHGHGETFVFFGWLTPLLALVGLVVLVRSRRWGIASLLAAGVVVPVVVALGTHLPTYRLARHVVPQLKVARVPERLLPIACLALAALLAFAVAAWPRKDGPESPRRRSCSCSSPQTCMCASTTRPPRTRATLPMRHSGARRRAACSSCPSACLTTSAGAPTSTTTWRRGGSGPGGTRRPCRGSPTRPRDACGS